MSSPEIDDSSISFWTLWMDRTSVQTFWFQTYQWFIFIISYIHSFFRCIYLFFFLWNLNQTNWKAQILTDTSLHNLWAYKWCFVEFLSYKSTELRRFFLNVCCCFLLLPLLVRYLRFNIFSTLEMNSIEFLDIFECDSKHFICGKTDFIFMFSIIYEVDVGNSRNVHLTLKTDLARD